MQDRHIQELCSALRFIGNAISYLAFAVIMSGIFIWCSAIGHH